MAIGHGSRFGGVTPAIGDEALDILTANSIPRIASSQSHASPTGFGPAPR